MNTEKLQKLQAQVIDWAEERGIYEKSDAYMQLLKTGEEILELLEAIHQEDKDEIKDALGNIQVCLINYCYFATIEYQKIFEIAINEKYLGTKNSYIVNEDILHNLCELMYFTRLKGGEEYQRGFVEKLIHMIKKKAGEYELDLVDCLESAYNVIKNRTGKMINGQFVKEK